MKGLSCLLGMIILISGIDLVFTTSARLSACPRCRRALPKGPRKLPHPGFPKKDTKQNSSTGNVSDTIPKNSIDDRSSQMVGRRVDEQK